MQLRLLGSDEVFADHTSSVDLRNYLSGGSSTPGTGIGGLLGQIAGAPPACSDNGSQTARLRLVRSKIFRAPRSVRCASDTEPRKASASAENRIVSKLGAWRPSRAAVVSTPTKSCSGWNISET